MSNVPNQKTRKITSHAINSLNEAIWIDVLDEPGPGGASHHYLLQPMASDHPQGAINPVTIKFQKGPIAEAGVNGISQEALLAVVIDRLESFQAGPYACEENGMALAGCRVALQWLQWRTRQRLARGVEGTSVK